MKLSIALSLVLFAACGPAHPATSGPTHPASAPPDAAAFAPPAKGALVRANLLTGDWSVNGAALAWLRPGGQTSAIYGVTGGNIPVVWVIDDAPDDAAIDDRHLTIFEYMGKTSRQCDEQPGSDGLAFTCTGGGGLTFRQNGSALDVEESTASAGPDTVHLTPADGNPAPALEDADRTFESDTQARGADGWAAHYADDAIEWHGTDSVVGKSAIHDEMDPVLKADSLTWNPTASRMLVADGLGVTAGTFTVAQRGGAADEAGHGTYLTLWSKVSGTWQVILDVGRPDR